MREAGARLENVVFSSTMVDEGQASGHYRGRSPQAKSTTLQVSTMYSPAYLSREMASITMMRMFTANIDPPKYHPNSSQWTPHFRGLHVPGARPY